MKTQDRAVSYILSNPAANVSDIMTAIPCGKSVAYAALSAVERVKEHKPNHCKRVMICGDYHCGHKAGLTPPEWFVNPFQSKLRAKQEEAWGFYSDTIKTLPKPDILIVNGDSIDGKGKRSGGTELITSDRQEQGDMAVRCIQEVGAKKTYMTYGTPYHTGQGEDHENTIAEKVGAECIKDQLWLDVNGLVFDVKHAVGGSSVPYGRATAVAKEKTWNREWFETDEQPKADIFIRHHVHFHRHTGDTSFLAMTGPALQAPDTKFGGRKCSGRVDFGFLYFTIKEGDTLSTIDWKAYIKPLETFKAKLMVA